MTATIINGNEVAKRIQAGIAEDAAKFKKQYGFAPVLGAVLAGDDPASQMYVNMKVKRCKDAGIESVTHVLSDESTQEEVEAIIEELNNDPRVHGILVQLPLPKQINEEAALRKVSLEKDVDGFHPINIGKLAQKGREPSFTPATPTGCMTLLKEVNAEKQLLAEQIKKLDHDRYWKNDEKRTTEISAVKSSLLNQPDFSTDGIWVTNRSTVSDKELQEGVTVELSKFSASVKGDDLNIGIVMQNTSSPRQAVGGYVCVTLVNNDQAPPLYKSVNKDELGESGYPSSYKSGSLYHISRRTSTKKMKFRLTEINEYYTDAMVFLYSYKGRLLNKKDVPLGKEIFLE